MNNCHIESVCAAAGVNQALKALGYDKVICYPCAAADVIHIHVGDATPFVAVDAKKFIAWFVKKKPYLHELKSMIAAKHKQNINNQIHPKQQPPPSQRNNHEQ